jgi:hypothetical protein
MGLDMYLAATKRVEKINWERLQMNHTLSLDSPEIIEPQFSNLMELTQLTDVATDIYSASVQVTCAYWRKANQIHNWFVTNVQDNVDNCREYYVSRDKLLELKTTCEKALNERNPSLLPPAEGYFFGNDDIDQYYWKDIKDTIEKLNRILALPDLNELTFSYQSSW